MLFPLLLGIVRPALLVLSAIFLAGCGPTLMQRINPSVRTHPTAVLLVGGYKGSVLKDKLTGEVVWISASEALFGRESLVVDPPSLGLPPSKELEPAGILDEVSIVPRLLSVDAYRGTILKLEKSVGDSADIFSFGYDWRAGNDATARGLASFVRELRERGYPRIVVVAHSMGGLAVSYFLRYGSQPIATASESWEGASLVDGVVFAGVPFEGALTIVRDMHVGIQQGLNRTLLSPEAVSSFRSSWQLLPNPESPLFVSPEGTPITQRLDDPSFWIVRNWGILNPSIPQAAEARAIREEFLRRELEHSQLFRKRLHAPLTHAPSRPLRCSVVRGTGSPTMGVAVTDSTGSPIAFTRSELRRFYPEAVVKYRTVDGDGTVAADAAKLPESWRESLGCTDDPVIAGHGGVTYHPRTLELLAEIVAGSQTGN
jgi:pimeloyl-ACP methyl ester carboxylesterase